MIGGVRERRKMIGCTDDHPPPEPLLTIDSQTARQRIILRW
jgi:hypothetical protein